MQNTHLRNELARARRAFERLGRVPYDIAVSLMSMGVLVQDLESKWADAA